MYPEQTDTMEVVPEVYQRMEGAKQQTRRHLHLFALGKQQNTTRLHVSRNYICLTCSVETLYTILKQMFAFHFPCRKCKKSVKAVLPKPHIAGSCGLAPTAQAKAIPVETALKTALKSL